MLDERPSCLFQLAYCRPPPPRFSGQNLHRPHAVPQGVMQVVDHCFEENTRLSNLTARLTRSLAEASEWQQHPPGVAGPAGDEGRRQRRKVWPGYPTAVTGYRGVSSHL